MRPEHSVASAAGATLVGALNVALWLSTCSGSVTGTPAAAAPVRVAAAAASARGGFPLVYDAERACIDHRSFVNDVLPKGAGEFATHGLDESYWGASHARTHAPVARWPGYETSWGKVQYDTYFGTPKGDGGVEPIAVARDGEAPGTPRGVRISAQPMPAALAGNPRYGAGWTAARVAEDVLTPPAGGELTVRVDRVDVTHQGWKAGIGRPAGTAGSGRDDAQGVVLVGTVTAGGCTVDKASGACSGGSTTITLSQVRYYEGGPGMPVPAGTDFQNWSFPHYYSGTLDTNVDQQYGFFVARVRLPKPAPALSPAWWMLETGGVGANPPGSTNLLRSEWDVEEQFGAAYGYDLNAGNILWNSGAGAVRAYGCGMQCPSANGTTQHGATGVYPFAATTTAAADYHRDYHDFGVLVSPGGPPFPTDYAGTYGVFVENNAPFAGTTFFLDGYPIAGHIGQPDLTQGSPDKELMLMFQVAAPGSWLDPNSEALKGNRWPQYFWVQWLRAYRPTPAHC